MCLTWCDAEGGCPPQAVAARASLGAIAAKRATKRFTCASFNLRAPFRRAPAAFGSTETFVPSRNVIPSWTPRSCTKPGRRFQAPSRAQRMKVWSAIHQGPSSTNGARPLASFSCRQRIAVMVRRRCIEGALACGRQASIRGFSIVHYAPANFIASCSHTGTMLSGVTSRNLRRCRIWPVVRAPTGSHLRQGCTHPS
jgi:hypothetical protein